MAFTVDQVRELVRYNQSVFLRFERSAARRGWKVAAANREIGHLSVKDTLVHILNVHEAWIVAVAQGRWEVFDAADRRGASVDSWAALRRYRARVWAEVDRFVRDLTPRDLSRRIKAPWMPGQYTIADAFLQTTLEEAHHLGEIIAVYRQHDWRVPDMTWIETLRQRGRRG